jgi:hypothetical protein
MREGERRPRQRIQRAKHLSGSSKSGENEKRRVEAEELGTEAEEPLFLHCPLSWYLQKRSRG